MNSQTTSYSWKPLFQRYGFLQACCKVLCTLNTSFFYSLLLKIVFVTELDCFQTARGWVSVRHYQTQNENYGLQGEYLLLLLVLLKKARTNVFYLQLFCYLFYTSNLKYKPVNIYCTSNRKRYHIVPLTSNI